MTSWCPDMFEDSPKRNTKRLFLYASQEIAEVFRQKFKVSGYIAPDYDYLAHMAWLSGATSAAQALIREIDVVKTAWGRGNDQETLSLIKVCGAHVLSVWLGGIDRRQGLTADARRVEYERAASSMLGVINKIGAAAARAGAMTARDVRDAVRMDTQWISGTEGEGRPLVYACLVLSRALEACGQRCVEWSEVSFPVRSVQEFLDGGALLETGLLGDSRRLQRVLDALAEGVGSMKRFHVMNMEGKVQPSGRP